MRVLERDPLGHGLGRAVVRLKVLCEGVKVEPVGSEQVDQGEVEQVGVRQACREGEQGPTTGGAGERASGGQRRASPSVIRKGD